MPTHTCPCASTSTHRYMHTPMFMNLCTYSLSQTHPHTCRWADTCVPALSWGTHTDTHAHTAMCMHLCMHSLSQTHTHAYAYVHAAVHVLSHIHPCTPKGRALSLLGTHTDMHAHTPMCMYLPMCSRTQIYIHSHELCVGHQRDRPALTLGCPTPFQKSMTRTCAQQDGHL